MHLNVELRDVTAADVAKFFEQQRDPTAAHMVAFTSDNHGDRDAFMAKWDKILRDDKTIKQTILANGAVAGSILLFELCGQPSVGYWIGREYWGKGVVTRALHAFLVLVKERPLFARTAYDNIGSIRVLEKCGFAEVGRGKFFANARGMEIEEVIHVLEQPPHRGN
jgi:RimJ/RimL family protein N-acetyltransferase